LSQHPKRHVFGQQFSKRQSQVDRLAVRIVHALSDRRITLQTEGRPGRHRTKETGTTGGLESWADRPPRPAERELLANGTEREDAGDERAGDPGDTDEELVADVSDNAAVLRLVHRSGVIVDRPELTLLDGRDKCSESEREDNKLDSEGSRDGDGEGFDAVAKEALILFRLSPPVTLIPS
jgi:hypothetical protein